MSLSVKRHRDSRWSFSSDVMRKPVVGSLTKFEHIFRVTLGCRSGDRFWMYDCNVDYLNGCKYLVLGYHTLSC